MVTIDGATEVYEPDPASKLECEDGSSHHT
jgi:hypothetical protein